MNKVMFSSKSMGLSTPQPVFEMLDKEFCFTLDPCAAEDNHKCEKWYSEADNGLAKSWAGERVFCNPPYGRQLGKWVEKCYREVYERGCPLVVMLIPARTDTRWFHEYIYHRAEIRFLRGRLYFGGMSTTAPFPSMVVIFRGIGV